MCVSELAYRRLTLPSLLHDLLRLSLRFEKRLNALRLLGRLGRTVSVSSVLQIRKLTIAVVDENGGRVRCGKRARS